MRRIASSRIALGLGMAIVAGLLGATVLAWATIGTTTTLRDAVGDMVRSDGYALPDATMSTVTTVSQAHATRSQAQRSSERRRTR